MESYEVRPTRARDADERKGRAETVAEVARRLPDAHRVIDKLHATWMALVSRTTPAWKKVLVALEAARLTWQSRKQKRDVSPPETRDE